MNKNIYLPVMLIGTLLPWYFFWQFFAAQGLDLAGFWASLWVNGAAGGAAADLFITGFTFLGWSFFDARQRGIRLWWLTIPATFLIGVSLGLPLYLYLRAGSRPQGSAG